MINKKNKEINWRKSAWSKFR